MINFKIENLNLSWSAIELYETCPFKFYQKYAKNRIEPSTIFALQGCAIHELLRHIYFTGKFNSRYAYTIWDKVIQKEYELSSKKEQYKEIKQEEVDKIKYLGYRYIKNFFELAIKENLLISTQFVEEFIKGNYKKHKLIVKIDCSLKLNEYGNTLLDWKTSSENRKDFYQLTLYAALYRKKIGEEIETIAPVYIKNKKIIYKKIDKDLKKETGGYIENIYNKMLNDKEFKSKKNKYCSTCYLKKDNTCSIIL